MSQRNTPETEHNAISGTNNNEFFDGNNSIGKISQRNDLSNEKLDSSLMSTTGIPISANLEDGSFSLEKDLEERNQRLIDDFEERLRDTRLKIGNYTFDLEKEPSGFSLGNSPWNSKSSDL
ncbi:hypothetical protein HK096_010866, partial [Nowakowskiella sp. JEL0078]